MSRFFEVRSRDGAARVGELSLRERSLQTPFMIKTLGGFSRDFSGIRNRVPEAEKTVETAETAETVEERGERRSSEKIVVSLMGEDLEIFQMWDERLNAESERPRGVVLLPDVHPLYCCDLHRADADFFVISFSSRLLKSPREFASLVNVRERIPSDSALWLPAVATPQNLCMLAYMGVDIVDDVIPVLKGYADIYMLDEGEMRVSEMQDGEMLPCNCEICASLSVKELKEIERNERAELIARHNSLLLQKEVKKVRMHILSGTLREYVEMRVRVSPFLTAVLRLLDADYYDFFERRAPVARRNVVMLANTMESLRRVEVKRFESRVIERYEPPSEKKVLLILPCSARKPYSLSKSHALFRNAVGGFQAHVHEIILTSPLGVVPRELEIAYPAAFYDVPVTGYWDAEERKWVYSCLRAYIERNSRKYDAIFVHIDGACREICRDVSADTGCDMIFTCMNEEKPTSKNALRRLKSELHEFCVSEGLEKKKDERKFLNVMKALADFQFGKGIGEKLIEGAVSARGKYPRLTLFQAQQCEDVSDNACESASDGVRDNLSGESGEGGESGKRRESGEKVLARVLPEYGLLSLTVRGAEKVRDALGDAYFVRIADFVPKDTIFASGVLSADESIRVNDEVLFSSSDGHAFGVGRAKMSGWEMVESVKGVAVRVREVKAREN